VTAIGFAEKGPESNDVFEIRTWEQAGSAVKIRAVVFHALEKTSFVPVLASKEE
jgi:hypothetical protein